MTVRFWIRHKEGWVKLALSDRRPLICLSHGHVTEAGWCRDTTSYLLARDKEGSVIVRRRTHRAGRDSAGRYDVDRTATCPLRALQDRPVGNGDEDTLLVPAWHLGSLNLVYDDYPQILNP